MKRLVAILLLAMTGSIASAQVVQSNTTTSTEQVISLPKTDWLMSFKSVKINAPVNATFIKVPTDEEVRITYDTKGDMSSKFKFEVDKKGLLTISEKSDPKRVSVTDVTIYYNTLDEVKIAHAKATFENVIESKLFDLTVSGGAMVSLNIKTLDTAVECTGSSRLTLGGSTKYLTMRVSTAKVDCSKLSTTSTTVECSHSAEVRIVVSERLEATTSTGAKLLYKGSPTILRNHDIVFGGDVINID